MAEAHIRLMPESLANQIAAGEVVQRPASVVKELLENARDAGADEVVLNVRDAGKTLVQVTDNGSGMSPADAKMAFERHATSKIAAVDDLFSLQSYGFRGEALASIAAVAQVQLKTRRPEDEVGTQLELAGGRLSSQEPCQLPPGTVLSVRNLFFNVPARRNFLKSDAAEMRHILAEFVHLALARPELRLKLVRDGHEHYNLLPASLGERLRELYPALKPPDLLPVDIQEDDLRFTGYVAVPEQATRRRADTYVFVNHRFIRSPYLHSAVQRVFEPLLPEGHHPLYALHLSIPPQRVDINIHPTKTEVAFENQSAVYQLLSRGVRDALARQGLRAGPGPTGGTGGAPAGGPPAESPAPAAEGQAASTRPLGGSREQLTSFLQQQREEAAPSSWRSARNPAPASAEHWQELYHPPAGASSGGDTATFSFAEEDPAALPPADELVAQAFSLADRWLAVPQPSGLFLIDPHLAHWRVQADLLAQREGQAPATQQLLYPEELSLTPEDLALGERLPAALARLGVAAAYQEKALRVSGLPSGLAAGELPGLLAEVSAALHRHGEASAELDERLRRGLSRRLAWPQGKRLKPAEREHLLRTWRASSAPLRAPNGQRVAVLIPPEAFERWLGGG